jgi:uncharacterized membrane protein YjjP (DUF1212 family)
MEHDPDDSELLTLIVELGAALNRAGEPVYLVQDRLTAVARAYGADHATVTAFPTYLTVTLGRGTPTAIALVTTLSGTPRLEQFAAFEVLLTQAERAEISPREGLDRLEAIRSQTPRFERLRSIAGYAILAMGICLVLGPAPREVAAAAVLGALVGVLRRLMSGQATLALLTPVIAAFAVSALSALAVDHELAGLGMRPMVAALVVFLPGVTLTTAVLELSAGQMISGASRLVAGLVQLALLAFGILAGMEAVGIPRTSILFGTEALLGAWSSWLGVVVFAIGVLVADAVPGRALPSLLLVLYAAWGAQVAASMLLGGYVAALIGSMVMTLTARAVERFPGSLPGRAAFVPGFWLLVPGALGLIGLTRFAGGAGPHELLVTTGSIFAVAIGVLCGTQLVAWAVATGRVVGRATDVVEREGWLRWRRPRRPAERPSEPPAQEPRS